MRNPENVLISLTKHSNQKDYKYERLYRLLYNEELYLTADVYKRQLYGRGESGGSDGGAAV